MMKHKILFLTALLTLFSFQLSANNLQITNGTLTGQNTTDKFTLVQFDIAWDNSWRTPQSWDAAWVFVKYSVNGGNWQHAHLNYVDGTATNDGHTQPSGSNLSTPSDGMGVFISRDLSGSGNLSFTGVQLRWNYGADGVNDADQVEVRIFGVEMVYIPTGEFAAGSGGTVNEEFTVTTINTADATVAPSGTGSLGGAAGGYPTGELPLLNANWPNGYNAFYCMKYEVSESQWISFFNTLSATQQPVRDITAGSGKGSDAVVNRNTVSWTSGSDATTAAPDRACGFISWADGTAYSDWAGLRPMSELEYEKACRGSGLPVTGEYAWGNANIHTTPYVLSNDGQPNEGITNPGTATGNCSYSTTDDALNGPLRCGIFAASAVTANAEETGGTFYGIMEMSGNLFERMVNVDSVAGRSFLGTHGDGGLDASGNADVSDWPGTNAIGSGFRGGSWSFGAGDCRISGRFFAANGRASRDNYFGWRAVRTAD